ncbi:MAG: sensor histidine kinase [Spirochaetia bacterium]|nr:sensor histidine kinase [Spirochaetia bacterium]
MKIESLRNQIISLISFIVAIILFSTIIISQFTYLSSLKRHTYQTLTSHNEYIQTILKGDRDSLFRTLDTYSSLHSIRITLLERDGRVAYDSDFDAMLLENHLFREEVQTSLQAGTGMSERQSGTQGVLVLYLSQFDPLSIYPIIRTSTPLNQLKEYRARFNKLLYPNILILIIIVSFLTIVSIRKITNPLKNVNRLIQQYAKGNLQAKMSVTGPSELTDLAFTLTNMATQLRGTIDELSASRVMIETMINSVSQGLLLLDDSMIVQIANTPSYTLLPSIGIIEGHPIAQIINSIEVLEIIHECKTTKTPKEIIIDQFSHLYGETARIVGKGNARTIKFAIDPINHESSSMALVITITDMSEIVKLEQMRKDFVANVSHELKTPITAIAGFSQTLLEEETQLSPTQQKFLTIIHRQGQNMLNIVQDLLLLSSLEQDKMNLSRTWVDIDNVIEQSIASCKYRGEEKEITIESIIENKESLPVFIHPILISQAITNLLTNAIAYSPVKSSIRVETTVEEDEVSIKVIDTGYGIPQGEKERIFERFYRVDTARSRSQGGTGLGLSIVKHIAHAHHGKVSVSSVVDKGSTFTLTIDRKGGEFSNFQKSRESIMD